MRNWGFMDEAVKVMGGWDLNFDENWYWNIYYLELDSSMENSLIEYYGALIR